MVTRSHVITALDEKYSTATITATTTSQTKRVFVRERMACPTMADPT
jgi:hypothetical protein